MKYYTSTTQFNCGMKGSGQELWHFAPSQCQYLSCYLHRPTIAARKSLGHSPPADATRIIRLAANRARGAPTYCWRGRRLRMSAGQAPIIGWWL